MSRSSLRALSIGIILTTAIFTILFYSQPKGKAVALNTQKIVNEYLTKNHLKTISSEEYNQLQSVKSKVTQLKKEKNQLLTKKAETTNQINNHEHIFTLTIDEGMQSSEISNKLKGANIIDNADKFEQFLITKGYDTSIQMGEFHLNSKMSYDEIARIITKDK